MQPTGDPPQPLDEEPLPRVVRLAELRVVGKVLGIRAVRLEYQAQEITGRRGRDDVAAQQVQHVGEIGKVQPAVQERSVGVLQGEAARHQLRCGRTHRRAAAADTRHPVSPRVRPVSAATIPPVCQNTAGVGASDARSARNKVMALAP